MTQSMLIQDLIARLDLLLPWLLPTLETLEQAAPTTVRLPICAILTVWFAILRHRDSAAANQAHRVAL